ncbi:MAG: hypothetical protein QW341_04820 [Candidatus Bathyarchaeia archaeon]
MEEKIQLKSIFLAFFAVIFILSAGLALYFLFKDSVLEIAMVGLILIFASIMSLLLFPPFILKILLKRRENLKGNKRQVSSLDGEIHFNC